MGRTHIGEAARRQSTDGSVTVEPGGQGGSSGGQRQFVETIARAAVAVGVAGVFMETHPNPKEAMCDGPNSWPLGDMRSLLEVLKSLDQVTKQSRYN